ncbi:MAG: J domain-containing protein [Comamonadaceae bacterium]|nr:MAG: J domain-containing protein [Comamonadaceae bacterium]
MAVTAYPLTWPAGWKRTPASQQAYGRFGTTKQSPHGSWRNRAELSIAEATSRLLEELERMGARRSTVVLSTNLVLRQDGLPRSGQAAPSDPGAAVYWHDPFNGQPRSMAIDRYTKVEQNIAALAATIEALRAIERHGGAVVLERAFTGFTALPAPIVAGMHRPWREVLEFFDAPRNLTADDVRARYRRLAAQHHPDRGGSRDRMAEINRARDEALKECNDR